MARKKQLEFEIPNTHGGKRRGAGRPNRSGLQGHTVRENIDARHPVHVTLKLAQGVPDLKRSKMFGCLRLAVHTARRAGFSAAHFDILSNHIHLIVEPKGKRLTKPLRSLAISFAKRVNAALSREGKVFRDRYHVHILKTPTEVKRALAHVLSNKFEHMVSKKMGRPLHGSGSNNRRDGGPPARWAAPKDLGPPIVIVDYFSSAGSFSGWKYLFARGIRFQPGAQIDPEIEEWHSEILEAPRTWLLREGWKRVA